MKTWALCALAAPFVAAVYLVLVLCLYGAVLFLGSAAVAGWAWFAFPPWRRLWRVPAALAAWLVWVALSPAVWLVCLYGALAGWRFQDEAAGVDARGVLVIRRAWFAAAAERARAWLGLHDRAGRFDGGTRP
ncbi:MAG: hypothetical protein AMXMBFR7_16180 [Planctomycetota bacterium]